MNGWQPIETAPKDGTRVLVADANSPWPYGTDEGPHLAAWDGYCWCIQLDGQSARPTHWMPLPAPPAKGESTQ
jgi:hypothetical protein